MNDKDKRELCKYLLSQSLSGLIIDYRNGDQERKQTLFVYAAALLHRTIKLRPNSSHVEKLRKFLYFTTGFQKIKTPVPDKTEEQP